jgi:hypothetical protein
VILSANIPFRADTFVRRCTDDVLRGRFAANPRDYLSFLIAETEKRAQYRKVLDYIRVLDRERGDQRFYADADHIIPQSVWNILMFGFIDPGRCGTAVNVLSNLFWRDLRWNRGSDQPLIDAVLAEAKSVRLGTRPGVAWRVRQIEMFLRTKREEGLPFPGDLVDPRALDELRGPERHSNWLRRG